MNDSKSLITPSIADSSLRKDIDIIQNFEGFTSKNDKRAKSVFKASSKPRESSPSFQFSLNKKEPQINEAQLIQMVLKVIRKYDIDPQKFNRVRFEMQREDKDAIYEVSSIAFKTIYKRLGIKTNI